MLSENLGLGCSQVGHFLGCTQGSGLHPLHQKYPQQSNAQRHKLAQWLPGVGRGRRGSHSVMGTGFLFYKMESSEDSLHSNTNMSMHLILLIRTLKMVKTGNFMLWIFYHQGIKLQLGNKVQRGLFCKQITYNYPTPTGSESHTEEGHESVWRGRCGCVLAGEDVGLSWPAKSKPRTTRVSCAI